MSKLYKLILIILAIILILLGFYRLSGFVGVKNPAPDTKTYKSSVNGVAIKRQDFQKELDAAKRFFEYSNEDVSKMSSLEKDVTQKMIDQSLVNQYAKNHNITVSDTEILNRYNLIVKTYNKRNNISESGDERFLAKIKELYGTDKNTYLEQVKNDILKEKVQVAVKIPLANWLTKQKNVSDIQIY